MADIPTLVASRKFKRYCLYSGAAIGAGYLAYEIYKRNVYATSVRYLESLRASVNKYTNAVDKGGDIVQQLLTDLYEYMMADEGDVPPSVKRLATLVQSEEFTGTTKSTVSAIIDALRSKTAEDGEKPSVAESVMGALLSDKGQNLVSVALGMAARNIVDAYMEHVPETSGNNDVVDKMFMFLSHPRGQELAVMCISACANNAMRAYMEQTMDVNYYDQMLSSMVKPEHMDMVKECISISIRAAVSAYVRGNSRESSDSEEEDRSRKDSLGRRMLSKGIMACSIDGTPLSGGGKNGHEASHETDSPCSALRPPLSIDGTPSMNGDMDERERIRPVRITNTEISRMKVAQHKDEGLIRALGREWINISQNQQSREALVSVVGCATKEAVGAVASTVADRLEATWFIAVLLLGIFSAIMMQVLLKSLGLL